MTAKIIKHQRIYCTKCGGQYNFSIKQENMCDSRIFSIITKYMAFLLLLIAITMGFLFLDALLKERHAVQFEEQATQLNFNMAERQWVEFGIETMYNGNFNIHTSVRWINFIYLLIIEIFLVFRCIQYKVLLSYQRRKRLIYAEVKNFDHKIPR